jgi:hypothetical protein
MQQTIGFATLQTLDKQTELTTGGSQVYQADAGFHYTHVVLQSTPTMSQLMPLKATTICECDPELC